MKNSIVQKTNTHFFVEKVNRTLTVINILVNSF